MQVPEKIEKAVLSLVENAGSLLIIDVLLEGVKCSELGHTFITSEKGNFAEIDGGRVVLGLIWPKNGDFSEWADAIVKAEELINDLEIKQAEERMTHDAYSAFVEKVKQAKEKA